MGTKTNKHYISSVLVSGQRFINHKNSQAKHYDILGGWGRTYSTPNPTPYKSLLFVLPFAMHGLILAGMSPVVESLGPEEQNSR